jgi:hypothetical protein
MYDFLPVLQSLPPPIPVEYDLEIQTPDLELSTVSFKDDASRNAPQQ